MLRAAGRAGPDKPIAPEQGGLGGVGHTHVGFGRAVSAASAFDDVQLTAIVINVTG